MDPITQQQTLASAGAAGAGDPLYVDDLFSTFLYDGTGSTQTITNGIDLAGEGGLVWLRNRDNARDHSLYDSERSLSQRLKTNSTGGNQTPSYGTLTFNSNGFTVPSGNGDLNANGFGGYTSWTFRKAPGFFDVVTWSGNSTVGRVIPHNLGSAPGMVIIKSTSSAYDWVVWHRNLANSEYLYLNSTAAKASSDNYFNNTTPDASGITLSSSGYVNGTGETYVAYIFAHDDQSFGTNGNESIIKCGTFTTDSSGNASVDLGWEPQYIITKSFGSGNWGINDSIRSMPSGKTSQSAPYAQGMFANLNNAEGNWDAVSPTSTGFNAMGVYGANNPVIYMAIRRPHKPVDIATKLFSALYRAGNGGAATVNLGYAPDLLITKNYMQNSYQMVVRDRLRSPTYLLQAHHDDSEIANNNGVTELTSTGFVLDADNHGGLSSTSNLNGANYINWAFRRAPGFFDIVTYTGDGTYDGSFTVNHSLEKAPELIIAKNMDAASTNWNAYHTGLTSNTYQIRFNGTSAELNTGQTWNPTSTAFSPQYAGNNQYSSNASGSQFIAYLFASHPGVSKVGSYTGTGNAINIDCGFTAGARFVLIKRIDQGSDTFIWDTTRGIYSGATYDRTLLWNSSNMQTTNQDYIDPLNAGFTVSSAAPAGVNANGGTYLFLAIA